jgi:hypothetical protein
MSSNKSFLIRDLLGDVFLRATCDRLQDSAEKLYSSETANPRSNETADVFMKQEPSASEKELLDVNSTPSKTPPGKILI